jgi:glycosyltransferase involved in cell wall biosynthesis
MRIVQLVENLEIGGLERLVVDLAREQLLHAHEPHIICLSQPGRFAPQAEAAGVTVRAFEKPSGPSANAVLRMARYLIAIRPDVVHTHSWVVHHYGVAAARLARVPVVVNTRHNIFVSKRQERWYRPSLPFTDSVVMVSANARDSFVKEGLIRPQRMTVIRNGIPMEQFVRLETNPGIKRPAIRFGTVGRLAAQKDHRTLLAAFALLHREMPSVELHILGDGPLRGALRDTISQLRLDGAVTLHGASLDVPAFLAGLDVFVLSSIYEGLPIVILEAMAAGLPVVSTQVGGIAEVCPAREVAFFAPPADPPALSEAMRQAARSPDLASMGKRAKAIAAKSYSIENTWLQYEELFRGLLSRRRGS